MERCNAIGESIEKRTGGWYFRRSNTNAVKQMNQTQLEEIANLLSNHILNDCAINYFTSPTGNLIDEETWCSGDFDEYVHDLIKEWDYLNNDILSNMKTGPFEFF